MGMAPRGRISAATIEHRERSSHAFQTSTRGNPYERGAAKEACNCQPTGALSPSLGDANASTREALSHHLLMPATTAFAAACLTFVCVGALIAQAVVLHDDVIHAIILGVIVGLVAWRGRDDILRPFVARRR